MATTRVKKRAGAKQNATFTTRIRTRWRYRNAKTGKQLVEPIHTVSSPFRMANGYTTAYTFNRYNERSRARSGSNCCTYLREEVYIGREDERDHHRQASCRHVMENQKATRSLGGWSWFVHQQSAGELPQRANLQQSTMQNNSETSKTRPVVESTHGGITKREEGEISKIFTT